jgi:hypothetical protein
MHALSRARPLSSSDRGTVRKRPRLYTWNRQTGVVVLIWSGLVAGCDPTHSELAVSNERVFVEVVRPSQNVDSLKVAKLGRFANAQPAVPGLPPHLLGGSDVSLHLTSELPQETAARADPELGVIYLPLTAVDWSVEDLTRTLRHELAHIALARFLEFKSLPAWLEEGFAEWAAGGLTCTQEARVRLDLVTRRRLQRVVPGLYELDAAPRPLAYAYYGLFIAHLDSRSGGSLANGSFWRVLKGEGIVSGLRTMFGADLVALEGEWQKHLNRRYAHVPADFSCPA